MWITPADSQVRDLASLTMDFDTLFQDLENQLEYELDAELINRLDDEERERRAKLTLRERLAALHQADKHGELVGYFAGERMLRFTVKNVGKDWAALDVLAPEALSGPVICPLHTFEGIELPSGLIKTSLGTQIGEVSDSALEALSGRQRLSDKVNFAFVLRDFSRRRKNVTLHATSEILRGTIDQVGIDHLDITTVSGRRVLPLRSVIFVQIS